MPGSEGVRDGREFKAMADAFERVGRVFEQAYPSLPGSERERCARAMIAYLDAVAPGWQGILETAKIVAERLAP